MEEFKVGDWLVLEVDITSHWYKGKIWQIKEIENNAYYDSKMSELTGGRCSLRESIRFCRKALPHEIPNNELLIEIW